MMEETLRQHAATVLRISASRIDLEQPLITMGIDSLMAVELKSRIERELEVTIPLLQLIKGPSLSELARSLIGTITGEPVASSDHGKRSPSEAGSGKSLLLSLLSIKDSESQPTAH
jgi:acyl carrier protein